MYKEFSSGSNTIAIYLHISGDLDQDPIPSDFLGLNFIQNNRFSSYCITITNYAHVSGGLYHVPITSILIGLRFIQKCQIVTYLLKTEVEQYWNIPYKL